MLELVQLVDIIPVLALFYLKYQSLLPNNFLLLTQLHPLVETLQLPVDAVFLAHNLLPLGRQLLLFLLKQQFLLLQLIKFGIEIAGFAVGGSVHIGAPVKYLHWIQLRIKPIHRHHAVLLPIPHLEHRQYGLPPHLSFR